MDNDQANLTNGTHVAPEASEHSDQARIDSLEATVEELRAQLASLVSAARIDSYSQASNEVATPTMPAPTGQAGDRAWSRRGVLLGGAGAAAAGAAALVSGASPAAAANGANLVLGVYTNTSSSPTMLAFNNATFKQGNFGLAAIDHTAPNGAFNATPAVGGVANGVNFSTGVQGKAYNGCIGVDGTSDSNVGVSGTSTTNNGVAGYSDSGNGVIATSNNGTGVACYSNGIGNAIYGESSSGTAAVFIGDTAQLRLTPNSGDRPPPLNDTVYHILGEFVCDGNGNLWYCIGTGKPGVWRKLTGPAASGALNVLPAPVRVYDSRPGLAPTAIGPKTPLAANATRTLAVNVNGSGVPLGATAVLVNLLVVNAAAGNGNLTIWANGVAKPNADNMVWGGTTGRFSSSAVTALDPAAKCQVSSSVQTDFVLDVVGYYF